MSSIFVGPHHKVILHNPEECRCIRGEPYIDGTFPEYFELLKDAVNKFIQYENEDKEYWGIHFQPCGFIGFHLLNVVYQP